MGKSNQTDKGLVKYEAGQTPVDMQAMSNSGDDTKFTITDMPWSQRVTEDTDYTPDVRPDGIITGGAVSPSSTQNKVAVADLTAYVAGVLVEATSISDVTITRSTEYAPGETYIINSIVMNGSGVVSALAGAEGSSFSNTRGADGGPPLIPTTSIELAQVKLDSTDSAVIETSEIFMVPGSSRELYDFPNWEEYPAGNKSDKTHGFIIFDSALPSIHVGSVTKNVYIGVYTPIFASLEPCSDFVPIETGYSQNSKQVYGKSLSSSSSSLNQGGFTYYGKDGITDTVLALRGQTLWFKFYQHRDKAPYILSNGIFGIARTFPPADNIGVACTITGEESLNFDS